MPRKEFESFTRLDASDVNTYLMDQSVMVFAGTAARGSAIPSPTQGMYTHLNDSDSLQYWDGSDWVGVASAGTASFSFVQAINYTTTTDFVKASYPWLRAINVKVQGGGGGGGGSNTTAGSGGGGGGGGYAESFITDIVNLAGTVTATVGGGGAGGAAGVSGSAGGNSSFGTAVIGLGGDGGNNGNVSPDGGLGGGGTGNLVIFGGTGDGGNGTSTVGTGRGGESQLGSGGGGPRPNETGKPGKDYGGGGGSGHRTGNSRGGGTGGLGTVIVELYA